MIHVTILYCFYSDTHLGVAVGVAVGVALVVGVAFDVGVAFVVGVAFDVGVAVGVPVVIIEETISLVSPFLSEDTDKEFIIV